MSEILGTQSSPGLTLESLSSAPYSYDHVPSLRELLPQTAGIPGIEYIQVCASNAKVAQDTGWGPVHGAKLFTITGPKGHADMLLACKGKPVQGASTQDGARRMFLDDDIYRLTGLWRGYLPKNLMAEFDVSELSKIEAEMEAPIEETSTGIEALVAKPATNSLEALIAETK